MVWIRIAPARRPAMFRARTRRDMRSPRPATSRHRFRESPRSLVKPSRAATLPEGRRDLPPKAILSRLDPGLKSLRALAPHLERPALQVRRVCGILAASVIQFAFGILLAVDSSLPGPDNGRGAPMHVYFAVDGGEMVADGVV